MCKITRRSHSPDAAVASASGPSKSVHAVPTSPSHLPSLPPSPNPTHLHGSALLWTQHCCGQPLITVSSLNRSAQVRSAQSQRRTRQEAPCERCRPRFVEAGRWEICHQKAEAHGAWCPRDLQRRAACGLATPFFQPALLPATRQTLVPSAKDRFRCTWIDTLNIRRRRRKVGARSRLEARDHSALLWSEI